MSLSLNKPKLDNLAGDIWKSDERLQARALGILIEAPMNLDLTDNTQTAYLRLAGNNIFIGTTASGTISSSSLPTLRRRW